MPTMATVWAGSLQNAFEDSGTLKNNDSVNKVTQATFTAGLGDRKAPP